MHLIKILYQTPCQYTLSMLHLTGTLQCILSIHPLTPFNTPTTTTTLSPPLGAHVSCGSSVRLPQWLCHLPATVHPSLHQPYRRTSSISSGWRRRGRDRGRGSGRGCGGGLCCVVRTAQGQGQGLLRSVEVVSVVVCVGTGRRFPSTLSHIHPLPHFQVYNMSHTPPYKCI